MANIALRLIEREPGGRRGQHQPRSYPIHCSCEVVALRNNITFSDTNISLNDWAYSYSYELRRLRRTLTAMYILYTMYRIPSTYIGDRDLTYDTVRKDFRCLRHFRKHTACDSFVCMIVQEHINRRRHGALNPPPSSPIFIKMLLVKG